jgi:hypothetical protein
MSSTSKNNSTKRDACKKFIQNNFLLIVLLGIGACIRFYNAPSRYNFGADSTRDALVAISGSSNFQLPLVGPFSSVGPFTFGPWYYYLLILFQFFFRSSYSPWIFMGIASLITTVVLYILGKKLINKNFGLILAGISMLSPALVLSSMGLTNPNLIPLFASLTILMFVIICTEKAPIKYGLFMGICLGIGISIHYQMLGMLLLIPIGLLWNGKKYIYFLMSILGLILVSLPTIYFEITNDWTTVRNFTDSYVHMRERIYVPNRWVTYVFEFWPNFWSYVIGLPRIAGGLLMSLSLLATLTMTIKNEHRRVLLPLLVLFGVSFLSLRYYPGERSYGYLQFYYPLIVIFTSLGLYGASRLIGGKITIGIAFILLAFAVYPENSKMAKSDVTNTMFTQQAEIIMKNTNHQPVSILACGRDLYEFRAEAIAILLYYRNKVHPQGENIVFLSDKCNVGKEKIIVDKWVRLKGIDAVYAKDKDLLLSSGYRIVDPGTVYKRTVEWYKMPR